MILGVGVQPIAFSRRTGVVPVGGAAPPAVQGGILDGDGNSLMIGLLAPVGSDPLAILSRMMAANFGKTAVVSTNYGVSGQDIDQMESDAVAQVDANITPSTNNVLIVWEHVNQRVGTLSSIALVKSKFRTYCQNRRNAGWYVIPITMTATGWTVVDTGQRFADWEQTERWEIDIDLQDGTAIGVYWDALADLSSDAISEPRVVSLTAVADYPENFIDAGGTWIHESGYGYHYVARVVFLKTAPAMGYTLTATQDSLHRKIKAFFPLAKVASETTANNPTLDSYGGNQLIASGAIDQNDYSISVSAGGERLTRSSHTLHAYATGFSVCLWVKGTTWGTDDIGTLICVEALFSGQGEWSVYRDPATGFFNLLVCDGGVDRFASAPQFVIADSATNAGTGVWHFIEIGYTGTHWYISVNNASPTMQAGTTTISTSLFEIGSQYRDMSVEMRGVIYSTSPLSTGERTYVYNGGVPRDKLFLD